MNNVTGPRKLRPEEHWKTRKLWEDIFTQDTKEFLDYYYDVKTKENEIFVMEDGDKIISMLHLNPYKMRVKNRQYNTNYIVAVATDSNYRKRGYMAQVLNYAMDVMRQRGEPFTFLMPARREIYEPFGFEFIYTQSRIMVKGKCNEEIGLEIQNASEADCKEMAAFANKYLRKYEVVTLRSEEGYCKLLKEYASQNGGILVARRDGKIVGLVCYAKGESYECLEPMFEQDEDLQKAVFVLTGNEVEEVMCMGYGEELSKPIIMAKVLQENFLFDLQSSKVFLNEVV